MQAFRAIGPTDPQLTHSFDRTTLSYGAKGLQKKKKKNIAQVSAAYTHHPTLTVTYTNSNSKTSGCSVRGGLVH